MTTIYLELDAEVAGKICRAQPDVGIPAPYVSDPTIITLSLNGRQLPEAALHMLEPFLLSDDDVREQVEDAILEGQD